ncbi:MAG: DUF2779 domain-containing protein [Chitinophagales bacterium]|nr:DUF2779 domain-containing protein [Chitinophagales bacterium]
MRGKQCHKSLWLYKHQPELREISAGQEAIFQAGTDIGLLAQELFPGGMDATEGQDYPNRQCVARTHELIEQGLEVIYEATFIFDDVLVAIDILAKEDGVWNIYEVKSTTKVKDPHISDAAVQKYVAEGCGLTIGEVFIVHLNRDYVRQGELDIQELFSKSEITEEIMIVSEEIPQLIEELKEVQAMESAPEVAIGPHCATPYPCDFMAHCWSHVPNYSVFNLTRIAAKAWDLYNQDIIDIKDIPDDYPLSKAQLNQVKGEKHGRETIDKAKIQNFLDQLNYPLYFLDFETFMSPLPLFDGTRSYDQSVFQYSLHIQNEPGGPCEHKEFLAEMDGKDPRRAFAEKMLEDCQGKGSIVVYNKTFEIGRIRELATLFPDLAEALLALVARIVDLMKPFQEQAYYKKEMMGSYSIKYVLPALAPELSYNDLNIADGGTASNTFFAMFEGRFMGDYEATTKDLLKYCERDTWAMVVILEKLRSILG